MEVFGGGQQRRHRPPRTALLRRNHPAEEQFAGHCPRWHGHHLGHPRPRLAAGARAGAPFHPFSSSSTSYLIDHLREEEDVVGAAGAGEGVLAGGAHHEHVQRPGKGRLQVERRHVSVPLEGELQLERGNGGQGRQRPAVLSHMRLIEPDGGRLGVRDQPVCATVRAHVQLQAKAAEGGQLGESGGEHRQS